jgi:hypothetical protein
MATFWLPDFEPARAAKPAWPIAALDNPIIKF